MVAREWIFSQGLTGVLFYTCDGRKDSWELQSFRARDNRIALSGFWDVIKQFRLFHNHTTIRRGRILWWTDPMNLLQKVKFGMGCPDKQTAMHSLRLQRLPWAYYPGHSGVKQRNRKMNWQAKQTSQLVFRFAGQRRSGA